MGVDIGEFRSPGLFYCIKWIIAVNINCQAPEKKLQNKSKQILFTMFCYDIRISTLNFMNTPHVNYIVLDELLRLYITWKKILCLSISPG